MSHRGAMLAGVYREVATSRDLAPKLASVVEAVWVRDDTGTAHPGDSGGPSVHRILPDGCTDLIWVDGALLVAGPDTRAHLSTGAPGSTYVAVRFHPGTGPAVLATPGHELRDGRVPLEALWPTADVRLLADRITAAPDRPRELLAIIEELLARVGSPDPIVAGIVDTQRAGRSVAATAGAVGLSQRQLHRRSLDAFGYGPKMLARVLRFRRAVALARGGVPFAEVAARAGYADQAHLAREVRALSGLPLRALTR